ncbi:MAG: hypothetical protein LBR17_01630 [Bacteroidales bacterium]|jgi:hypothetical protein|nr:hypothetical protein [Bacteroidales bacterium]
MKKIIDLIIDVLEQAELPLVHKTICYRISQHADINKCEEYNRVKVPTSAVARCLTKYTTGTNPIIGIMDEEHASFRKYYLLNKDYNYSILREIDLHPCLVMFIRKKFGVYAKTIQATKIIKRTEKSMTWTNPDIVGINPIILNWNPFFQQEVEKLGIFSNKVMLFYSFELKLKIDKSTLIANYFQAVSNSSWANFNYLVVGDLDKSVSFIEELKRLNKGYGIGVIKLNMENPVESEIIVEARENENVDINFMNFLSTYNQDFLDFMQECLSILNTKKINLKSFDK